VRVAGLSLCQDYLAQVSEGSIVCRPGIEAVRGRTATFTDGSTADIGAIICATGYDVDIPYLGADVRGVIGEDLALYQRTFHPDLWGLGFMGQFLAQGPYFPLLDLQARWITAVWSGEVALPDDPACGGRSRSQGRRSMPTTRSLSRSPRSSGSPPTRLSGTS
jgi:hypothetical protein